MSLRKLIEAVEAGRDHSEKWHPALGEHGFTAMMAFHGSINAAKALHDALLPGWGWAVEADSAACVWHPDTFGRSRDIILSENPARAWLIAILRAMEAEGRE